MNYVNSNSSHTCCRYINVSYRCSIHLNHFKVEKDDLIAIHGIVVRSIVRSGAGGLSILKLFFLIVFERMLRLLLQFNFAILSWLAFKLLSAMKGDVCRLFLIVLGIIMLS